MYFVRSIKLFLTRDIHTTYTTRLLQCVCDTIPFILDMRLVDVPAVVIQEEGNTGSLHLPTVVLALIFIARRVQPPLSFVDPNVEFCVPTIKSFFTCGLGMILI